MVKCSRALPSLCLPSCRWPRRSSASSSIPKAQNKWLSILSRMEKDTRCDTTGCVYKQTTKTILVKKKKNHQILPTSPASVITLGPGNSFSLLPAQCLADRKQDACSVHEARRNHLSATYETFPRSSEILSCLSLAFRQAALARNTKKWEMRTWKFPAANGG